MNWKARYDTPKVNDIIYYKRGDGHKRYARIVKIQPGRFITTYWGYWANSVEEAKTAYAKYNHNDSGYLNSISKIPEHIFKVVGEKDDM